MITTLRALCATVVLAVIFAFLRSDFNTKASAGALVQNVNNPENIVLSYIPTPVLTEAHNLVVAVAPSSTVATTTVSSQPTVSGASISDAIQEKRALTSPYGHLLIPTIGLSKDISPVGLTTEGAMDVLNDPNHVSWFSAGARPGNNGSAVIAAHVFQSFANLHNVKPGDDVYIEQHNGSRLHFVVQKTAVYLYTDVASFQSMFNRNDGAYLNLITCYGDLTGDHSTYTHRFVVYTKFVGLG